MVLLPDALEAFDAALRGQGLDKWLHRPGDFLTRERLAGWLRHWPKRDLLLLSQGALVDDLPMAADTLFNFLDLTPTAKRWQFATLSPASDAFSWLEDSAPSLRHEVGAFFREFAIGACPGSAVGSVSRCCFAAAGLSEALVQYVEPGLCDHVALCCSRFATRHGALALQLRKHLCHTSDDARLMCPMPLGTGSAHWTLRSQLEDVSMVASASHAIEDESGRDCLEGSPYEQSMCFALMRWKDPHGCLHDLQPAWARINAWVRCCADHGVIHASVMVAPCPPVWCCQGGPALPSRDVDGVLQPMPAWVDCSQAADVRWREFLSLLSDPRESLGSPTGRLLELASQLADPEGDGPLEALWRRRAYDGQWDDLIMADEACLVGYASAVFVMGQQSDDPWLRFLLLSVLGLGIEANPSHLLFGMSGWLWASSTLCEHVCRYCAPHE